MSGYHEEEALGKAYDGRLMRRLVRFVAPYRGLLGLSALLLLCARGADIVQPYLLKLAIDGPIARGSLGGLAGISLLYIAALVAEFLFSYAQLYVLNVAGQRVMLDMRLAIFGHVQRLPVRYFDRNPVGRIFTRVTSDVENLHEMLTSGVVAVFGDLVMAGGVLVAMLALDVRLSLVTFAILPVLALASTLYRKHARAAYREVRAKQAVLNATLQEHLSGMRIVQLFAREAESYRRFDAINRQHRAANLRALHTYAIFYPAVEVIASMALALILWYGGGGVLAGALSLGGLVAFLEYARRFFDPIKDLSEKYNIMQAAMASSERIFQLLDTPPEPAAVGNGIGDGDEAAAAPPPRLRGEVEFRNVWFGYEPGEPVLRGVSFSVRPGERVALVGATGAGKTSVVNLLTRFYEADRGQVLVDGRDVREYAPEHLRRRIGIVFQEPFLFSDSVAGNIRVGREDIDEEAARAAAGLVGADLFIDHLPRGVHEPVAERGASLSVGQRQLLAFARALAYDPDILILDEATSSIDAESEHLLQEGVATLAQHRTAIIVAHRLATVRHVDRILVFHRGELREAGTHDELLAAGGIYARLHRLQANGFGGGSERPDVEAPARPA
jgi:ATP-binding cassette subfamily B protein